MTLLVHLRQVDAAWTQSNQEGQFCLGRGRPAGNKRSYGEAADLVGERWRAWRLPAGQAEAVMG